MTNLPTEEQIFPMLLDQISLLQKLVKNYQKDFEWEKFSQQIDFEKVAKIEEVYTTVKGLNEYLK